MSRVTFETGRGSRQLLAGFALQLAEFELQRLRLALTLAGCKHDLQLRRELPGLLLTQREADSPPARGTLGGRRQASPRNLHFTGTRHINRDLQRPLRYRVRDNRKSIGTAFDFDLCVLFQYRTILSHKISWHFQRAVLVAQIPIRSQSTELPLRQSQREVFERSVGRCLESRDRK